MRGHTHRDAERVAAQVRKNRNATHLLREVAAGRDRIFYTDERPPGWLLLYRKNIAVQDAADDNRAILTAFGRDVVDLL